MEKMEALAAGALVSSATLTALTHVLLAKGMLAAGEIDELYNTAILLLKGQEARADSELKPAFTAAHSFLEQLLRPH